MANDTPADSAPPADHNSSGAPTPASPSQPVIPGAEMLRLGLYLTPRQPYLLRKAVVDAADVRGSLFSFKDKQYSVPKGCAVNASPPMPADQVLGQTVIEESWDRFGKEVAFNANAAVSSAVLSLDATAFQASSLHTNEESYYALRSSFVPFWEIYLPKAEIAADIKRFIKVLLGRATPFDPDRRATYAQVFETYGTHYVQRVWVGGKASLVFVVSKSSQLSKEEIKIGLQTAFSAPGTTEPGAGAGTASASISRQQTESRERLRNSSSCKVFGSGGDPLTLAKLTTLDADAYNQWLTSVEANPQVIQLGVAGIWTLLDDPDQAESLRQAYLREHRFTSLSAVIPVGPWQIFIKDNDVFDFWSYAPRGQPRVNVLTQLYSPETIQTALGDGTHENKQTVLQNLSALGALFTSEPGSQPDTGKSPGVAAAALLEATTPEDLDPVRIRNALNYLILYGQPIIDSFHREAPPVEPIASVVVRLRKSRGGKGSDQNPPAPHPPAPLPPALSGVEIIEENRRFCDQILGLPSSDAAATSLATYLPVLDDRRYSVFAWPHTAFSLYGFPSAGEPIDDTMQVDLFKWGQLLKLQKRESDRIWEVAEGYPRPLQQDWKGVDFVRLDAAVPVPPDRVYFFSGSEYIRIDIGPDGMRKLVRRDLIRNGWAGLTFEKIDTAVYWGNSKIFFFYEDQYIRYDMKIGRADPGYPRFLSSDYVEDWELFGC